MSNSVYKKSSPNNLITLYLQNRSFTISDDIDGIVLFDPTCIRNKKLFCQLILNFRYGRQADEVMGLKFYKEFCLESVQIYPPLEKNKFVHTEVQDSLITKHGPGKAYPFLFRFSNNSPISVILQTGKKQDKSKSCGIHYYIRAFTAELETDKSHKRNEVKFDIRHVQSNSYKQFLDGEQPHALINQNFITCAGDVELEASLNRRIYHYGEKIPVNVVVRNNSNKIVKKIKVTLHQRIDTVMVSKIQYTRLLDKYTSRNGCPVQPGATLQTILYTVPTLNGLDKKHGIAVDSHFKNETAKLSPTTVANKKNLKDTLGVGVSYFIKVQLILGPIYNGVSANLPFVLMHSQADITTYG